MAKFIFTTYSLFLIIFLAVISIEIQYAEGRHLKSSGKKDHHKDYYNKKAVFMTSSTDEEKSDAANKSGISDEFSATSHDLPDEYIPTAAAHVDVFQPTVAAAGSRQPPIQAHMETDTGHLLGTSFPSDNHAVDDFRPTTPGHSPGVGHSLRN